MLKTQEKNFAAFTADDILKAWLEALVAGLGPGRTFEPAIIDLKGQTAKELKARISAQLTVRPFDAAAFRASTWPRTLAASARSWPTRPRTRS